MTLSLAHSSHHIKSLSHLNTTLTIITSTIYPTGKYYPGKITRDNRDNTFDILYDDGENETRIENKLIRLLVKKAMVPVATTSLVNAVSAGTTALQVHPCIIILPPLSSYYPLHRHITPSSNYMFLFNSCFHACL